MELSVCIGSSCHIKGSRHVVEEFQRLIDQYDLKDKVELSGTFCKNNCQKGVAVTLNEVPYSLTKETALSFFEQEVLPIVKN